MARKHTTNDPPRTHESELPHEPARRRSGHASARPGSARPPETGRRRSKPRWGRIIALLLVVATLLAAAVFGVVSLARLVLDRPAAAAQPTPTATVPATQTASVAPTATAPLESTAAFVKSGPASQLVNFVKMFKCVPAPKGLAISPDNKEVWVTALVTRPSIGIYDPRTGRSLGKVNLGKYGAVEVIFNADGTLAYASQMQSHTVYEIDTKARKVLRTFNTGSPWTKVVLISPDGTKLYAANWSGDDVSEISLKSGKLLRRIHTAEIGRAHV
jgi:hypothetical protein